jgi:hypothetical protein
MKTFLANAAKAKAAVLEHKNKRRKTETEMSPAQVLPKVNVIAVINRCSQMAVPEGKPEAKELASLEQDAKKVLVLSCAMLTGNVRSTPVS